jgi:hypothetical protein
LKHLQDRRRIHLNPGQFASMQGVGESHMWGEDADVDRNRDVSVDEELLVSSVRGLTLLPHDILDEKGER